MNTTNPTWEHDDLVHAWWVIPGRLLAGEYPGAKEPEKTARKLKTLRDAGVDSFVDLTEAGEKTWGGAPMVPYADQLSSGELSGGDAPATHVRFPIPDTSVIDDAGYDRILAHIRAELDAGRVVYVHCWGGKGRTGTVVGAWLIADEGVGYPEVLDRMQELRRGTRKSHESVPDTAKQEAVLECRARRAAHPRDWFERLTGFQEDGYASTQERLRVEADELISTVNGKRYGIGELTLPTLAGLRDRVNPSRGQRTSVDTLVGEARGLHRDPRFAGALFQAASQFNVLEMTSYQVPPEAGVTGYELDRTQGPACAVAAGAATIYRNYFAPVGGGIGQTVDRQIDNLAGVGAALSELTGLPVTALWAMRNGYALCTDEGLAAISRLLDGASDEVVDDLRGRLAIGLHRDVQVTDLDGPERRLVSQAYCAALPILYSRVREGNWEPLARLVLEATYEATLLAGAEQAGAGGSNIVLLTRVGGGVFGNDPVWIDDAIERALGIVEDAGLDVRIVCHGAVPAGVQGIVDRWAGYS